MLLLVIVLNIPAVLALADVLRTSEAKFGAIGQKKIFWVAGIVVSVAASPFISPIAGAITGIFYLFKIKPLLAAA